MPLTVTGNTTTGDATVSSVSPDTADLAAGMVVSGVGIPAGTTIGSITDGSNFELSQAASADGTGVTLTFYSLLGGSASAAFSTSLDLSVKNLNLGGSASAAFSTSLDLSVKNLNLSGSASVAFSASLDLYKAVYLDLQNAEIKSSGELPYLSVDLPLDLAATGEFSACMQLAVSIPILLKSAMESAASLELFVEGAGLTVKDAVLDLGMLLEFSPSCPDQDVPLYVRRSTIHALNAAMQDLFSLADDLDYYQIAVREVQFDAAEFSKQLGNDVQDVLGDVFSAATGKSLSGVASREEFDHYEDWYLENDENPDEPVAFHIDREKQASTDSVKIKLMVTPAPTSSFIAKVEVAVQPGRYTWQDYRWETELQVPHRYAESILLPIARAKLLHNEHLSETVDREAINRDYARALGILGKVDPMPIKRPIINQEVRS